MPFPYTFTYFYRHLRKNAAFGAYDSGVLDGEKCLFERDGFGGGENTAIVFLFLISHSYFRKDKSEQSFHPI